MHISISRGESLRLRVPRDFYPLASESSYLVHLNFTKPLQGTSRDFQPLGAQDSQMVFKPFSNHQVCVKSVLHANNAARMAFKTCTMPTPHAYAGPYRLLCGMP